LLPETAAAHPDELEHITSLVKLVIAQDGRACELNQQGLRCHRHEQGVLVPQESGVAWIHDWVRARLNEL
jgi:Rieske 2Fe-2S family protein